MPSFQQISAIASFLPLALALPAGGHQSYSHFHSGQPRNNSRSFSVAQVYNPNFSGHNGKAAMAKAIGKFGLGISEDDASTSTSITAFGHILVAEAGDADATSNDGTDLEYLTPVVIDGKTYLLDFDTGSSNFWIGGASTKAINKFAPTGSAIKGDSWAIQYGDSTGASGDVFSKTVTVGETIVTDVAVGRATQAADSFFYLGANGQPGSDGLLGLGFSSMNTFSPQAKTWFDQAISQGLPAIFGVNLMAGSTAGSYDFGQLNSASYSGDITYTPVDSSSGYWMVTPTKGDRGVVDTGTTLILLSDASLKAFYGSAAALAAGAHYDSTTGGYLFNCSSTLPDFSVEFGTHKATVPGAYLNYGSTTNGQCFGGIQSNVGAEFAIYGDRFLMAQYVVFDKRDAANPRLGFAAKAGAA